MRHLSFDFWNTVGVGHRGYSYERNLLLADYFGVSVEMAKSTYARVKKVFDDSDEHTGGCFTRDENFIGLFRAFGHIPHRHLIDDFAAKMDMLFAAYPAIITPALTEALLRAHDMGLTLSIGSNTNFLMGASIRPVLKDIPFDFQIYSDEVDVSKPHSAFFKLILDGARAIHPDIERSEICHIGDNPVCDFAGAKQAGFKNLLVRNAGHTSDVVTTLFDSLDLMEKFNGADHLCRA